MKTDPLGFWLEQGGLPESLGYLKSFENTAQTKLHELALKPTEKICIFALNNENRTADLTIDSIEAIMSSFGLVAMSEMGDKTQLLAFSLASRFKKPIPILLGIFTATVVNHWLATLVGATAAGFVSPRAMSWTLGIVFVACGFWALIPDQLEEGNELSITSAFLTTTLVFFIAEMGDKTQLATVALAAHYVDVYSVTLGSTTGMMAANSLAVFLGHKFAEKVRSKWVRRSAAALFFIFGVLSIAQGYRTV